MYLKQKFQIQSLTSWEEKMLRFPHVLENLWKRQHQKTTLCDLCFSHSENTQYQMLYSRGTGVIHVLGVVPQSHLKVLTLRVEDGEVVEQVVLDYGPQTANLIRTNTVRGVVSVNSFFKDSFAVDIFVS